MDTTQYLAKVAAKIDQWEKEIRTENQGYRSGGKSDLRPAQAEKIARAWIELAAIERGVAPMPSGEES